MAIVAVLAGDGTDTKWEGDLVNRFDAVQRVRRGEPVVRRDWGPGKRFRFSLAPGEMFTLPDEDGSPKLYIVRSISEGRVEFVRSTDARRKVDIKAAHEWFVHPPNTLRKAGCRKVRVTYLGEVLSAND